MRKAAFPLAIALLAAALYAPTLRYPMQWDDRGMLVDSASFASIGSAAELLTVPYRVFFSARSDGQPYYRPVNLALLFLERRVFGVDPFGYRVVHAGLHVLCCLLVYALLLGLLAKSGRATDGAGKQPPPRLAAAFGAGLFAVAPYGVDTVLFLTSAGDQLVLLFSLVALLAGGAFLEGRGVRSLALLALSSVLCVFSKENGAVLPVFFALYAFATGAKPRSRRFAVAFGVTVFAAVALIAARAVIISGSPPLDDPKTLGRALAGIALAARFAVAPHPFGMEAEVPAGLPAPAAIAGVVVLALFAAAGWLLRKKRVAVFGIAWWIATFAPSWIIVACTGTLAARYLYIPAAGLAVLAAYFVSRAGRPALLGSGGAVAVFLVFAAIRIFAWSDDFRLWSREVEANAGSSASMTNLARAVLLKGDVERAEHILLDAVQAASRRGDYRHLALALSNLCRVLSKEGRIDEALSACRRALEADTACTDGWMALGDLHARDGSWEKAVETFRKAVESDPGGFEPLIYLAGAAAAAGDRGLAMDTLRRAGDMAGGDQAKREDLRRRRAAVLEKLEKTERVRR